MRTLLYILASIAGVIVLAVILNWPSDADMVEHRRRARLDEACKNMLADASPGAEKRTTREICEGARRQAK